MTQDTRHLLVATVASLLSVAAHAEIDPAVFDPDARVTLTRCDEIAGYAHDRDRLGPARSRDEIDAPSAIDQCLRDLERFPGDPRLNYQLGRLFGYVGRHEDAVRHREAAARAGYPAALFALGYLKMTSGKSDDVCKAERLMRLSADRGGFAGEVGYSAYVLRGQFDACAATAGTAAIARYLERAADSADGYFQRLLIEQLTYQLQRRH